MSCEVPNLGESDGGGAKKENVMTDMKILYELTDLKPVYKNFLLVTLLSVAGAIYYSFSNSLVGSMVIVTLIAVALFFTKNLWTPQEYRKPLLTNFSLGGFWVLATTLIANYEKLKPILIPVISSVNPFISKLAKESEFFRGVRINVEFLNSLIVVFLVLVVFLVNYVFRKKTIVLPHPNQLNADLPDLKIKEKIRAISQSLKNELDKIDKETNWSDYYFTPIDAEVEVVSNNRREKRVTDLMNALRKNKKSRAFLILGDPGSGKSVALRKLAKELLEESADTGRIALYVNLKEWEPEIPWSENNKPTARDVHQFIFRNIKGKLDLFGNNFMDSYFEKMHSQGRFFYIIDSFDEMPSVLDVSESSWLVSDLSHAIYQFVTSGVESRGIVASRIFRRPNKYFNASIILELRPLSDYKIKENLEKSEAFNGETVDTLFHTRVDLLPLASNPFMAALLINFVKSNNGVLPTLRSELFQDYIDNRLDAVSEKIEQFNLSKTVVVDYAIEVAHHIFQKQKSGLEISLKELNKHFAKKPYSIEQVIQVLEYAKIAKLGKGNGSMFSFVHRRFNEYFVVQKMLHNESQINLDSIPSDSRYRDALVLYCEVAPFDKAISIAEFCWQFIKKFENKQLKLSNENHVKAIFCLRFLKEAFMMRLECIEHFRSELSTFILFQMNSANLLLRKIIVETSPIICEKDLEEAILIAFNTSNPVVQEAGFKAGRYLTAGTSTLDKTIIKYILQFDLIRFFNRKTELLFALKLTPTFSKVYIQFKFLVLDRYLFLLGLLLSLFSVVTFLTLCMCLLYKKALGFFLNHYLMTKPSLDEVGASVEGGGERVNKPEISQTKYRLINIEFVLRLICVLSIIAAAIIKLVSKQNTTKSDPSWLMDIGFNNIYFICVIGFLVFPTVDLVLMLRNFKVSFKVIRKQVVILIAASILMGFSYFVASKLDKDLVLLVAKVMLGLVVLAMSLNFLKHFYKDRKILKNVKYFDTLERKAIAETLAELFYPGNRMKYVISISQNVKRVNGSWPNDIIPNYHDDASSFLLSLEEKWHNLGG